MKFLKLHSQFADNDQCDRHFHSGNTLISKLISEVSTHTSTVPPKAFIASGAFSLGTLTSSPSVLYGLRQAYVVAVSAIMICATVTIGV